MFNSTLNILDFNDFILVCVDNLNLDYWLDLPYGYVLNLSLVISVFSLIFLKYYKKILEKEHKIIIGKAGGLTVGSKIKYYFPGESGNGGEGYSSKEGGNKVGNKDSGPEGNSHNTQVINSNKEGSGEGKIKNNNYKHSFLLVLLLNKLDVAIPKDVSPLLYYTSGVLILSLIIYSCFFNIFMYFLSKLLIERYEQKISNS